MTINNSFDKEYNFYRAVEIANKKQKAGGIMTFEEKKELCIKKAKKSIQFFKRELINKEDVGESTEKTKNKLIKYEKDLSECYVKNKSLKKDNSKSLTKNESSKFTINIINKEIQAEKKKAANLDSNKNFQEWADQLKEIKDKIDVLEFLKIAFSRYEYTEANIGSTSGSMDKLIRFGIELIAHYSSGTEVEVRETAEKVKEFAQKAEKLGLTKNNEVKKLINEINSAIFVLEMREFQ
ncbi:hypothetical protein OA503_06340 [Prochlorococcus sp. AH-716-K03]|nr:hypothetical protein [Prochlorococcus sp. AH-716-K03]